MEMTQKPKWVLRGAVFVAVLGEGYLGDGRRGAADLDGCRVPWGCGVGVASAAGNHGLAVQFA